MDARTTSTEEALEGTTSMVGYLQSSQQSATALLGGTSPGGLQVTEASESHHKSYVEFEAGRWLLLLYRPLCAVTGLIGNTLCVTVVVRSQLRHSPTAVYMVALAALDLMLSAVGFLHILPTDAALGEEHFFKETWHCRLFYFTLLFLAHWDVLTLVAMTGQRYVAIAFPLRAARWNSKRLAVCTVAVAALVSFLVNWPHLVMLSASPFTGQYRSTCLGNSAQAVYFFARVYPWLDMSLYFFFPIIAIAVFNILIYRSIHNSKDLALDAKSVHGKRKVALVPSFSDSSPYEVETGQVTLSLSSSTSTICGGTVSSETQQCCHHGPDKARRQCHECSNSQRTGAPASEIETCDFVELDSYKQYNRCAESNGKKSENATVSDGILMRIERDCLRQFEGSLTKDKAAASEGETAAREMTRTDSLQLSQESVRNLPETPAAGLHSFGRNPFTNRDLSHPATRPRNRNASQEIPTLRKSTTSSTTTRSAQQITRMLVCVSVAFVVLTSPVGVFVVVLKFWNPASGHGRALLSLLSVVSESLMYTNHSVNFILYCLAGTRFRRAAAEIICCCTSGSKGRRAQGSSAEMYQ